MGLTLAMARSDSLDVFPDFKRTMEAMLRVNELNPSRPAVAAVPFVHAGLLYMAASVMALHREAWHVLNKLLTTKFEWHQHSEPPLFNYGFDMPYFFHSDALARSAPKTHDLFRQELNRAAYEGVTELDSEGTIDAYLQVQMLMCLRAAQLCERGDGIEMWADFARYDGARVTPVLRRACIDEVFATGLVRSFAEDLQTFLKKLPERLDYIQQHFSQDNAYSFSPLPSWMNN
jgi:hypothetical protein